MHVYISLCVIREINVSQLMDFFTVNPLQDLKKKLILVDRIVFASN